MHQTAAQEIPTDYKSFIRRIVPEVPNVLPGKIAAAAAEYEKRRFVINYRSRS